ncbi:MAG: CDP-archaeol synthase [Bacilli bacterium]
MKTRVISAIVALAIFVPIFLIGGDLFNLAVYVIAILGLKEFLDIRETRKPFPNFVKFISYVMLTLIIFGNTMWDNMMVALDIRIIAGLFLTFLIPAILYHDKKLFSMNDAFYLIGGIFFLGVSFAILLMLRSTSLAYVIYLFLITIMTDTFAYNVGMLIGRNKLLESISPNKTWEGMVGGTVFGVFIATVYYHVVIDSLLPIYIVILMTLFLSILGQLGDLVFSAIKRYFGKKDFSNIMPGHGGVLDRLDSIIFVMLGFMFFISII